MSTYTRLNLGAIPADTAVHTKYRNCTGPVLVPRVTLSCNKRQDIDPFQYSLATKVCMKKINTVVGGHAMNHAKVSIGTTR